jgi:membrane-bound inhibitor of C-type lysozyme
VTVAGLRIGLAAVALLCAAHMPPAVAQTFQHYECDGGAQFDAAFLPDDKAAFVQLDGKSLRLPKFVALTGTRYRGNGVTIWINGERVTLRRAGKRIECKRR